MSSEMTEIRDKIAEILQSERAESFAPFFSDRVMKRLASTAESGAGDLAELYDSLRWVFVRAAVACLILIVAIGFLNASQFGSSETGTLFESLLGLPSDALADVLTYDLI